MAVVINLVRFNFVKSLLAQLVFGAIILGLSGLLVYLIWFGEVPPFLFPQERVEPVIEEASSTSGELQNQPMEQEVPRQPSSALPSQPTMFGTKVPPPLPQTVAQPVYSERALDPRAFVALHCDGRAGTGFIVKENGTILTVKHLIQAMSDAGETIGTPAEKCWVWTLPGFNQPPPQYVVFEADVVELGKPVADLPFADDFALLKIERIATSKQDCFALYPTARQDDALCAPYFDTIPTVFPSVAMSEVLPKLGESVINVGLPTEYANTKNLLRVVGAVQESYRNVLILNGNTEGGFSGGAVVNARNEVSGLIYASDRADTTYAVPLLWIKAALDNF